MAGDEARTRLADRLDDIDGVAIQPIQDDRQCLVRARLQRRMAEGRAHMARPFQIVAGDRNPCEDLTARLVQGLGHRKGHARIADQQDAQG
ncbi:hypothetical protein D3C72_2254980 [compost metagenome]